MPQERTHPQQPTPLLQTIGNHEFDHGVEGVVPFLQTVNSPVVVCNIDDADEPDIQGLYSSATVIDKYDRRIGVIGVILQSTNVSPSIPIIMPIVHPQQPPTLSPQTLANTGKLRFRDEAETVRAEAAKLKADGVDIIIVLSHSGLDVDLQIGANCGPDVDVIVGGHSHTFLFTGSNAPGPDRPRGDYPSVVEQKDGHKVYVVQASAYTKYLGDITFYFDDAGEILSFEGAPHYLDNSVVPGEEGSGQSITFSV